MSDHGMTPLYVVRATLAQELASDKAWERAQARYRERVSTSVTPWLCRCGEWSAAERQRCRVCGSARVT